RSPACCETGTTAAARASGARDRIKLTISLGAEFIRSLHSPSTPGTDLRDPRASRYFGARRDGWRDLRITSSRFTAMAVAGRFDFLFLTELRRMPMTLSSHGDSWIRRCPFDAVAARASGRRRS